MKSAKINYSEEAIEKGREEFERICEQDLYQWLRFGEGRSILFLLSEQKISAAKAAQTIVGVYVLKQEHIIPCIYCDKEGEFGCGLCQGTGVVALEPEN